MIFGASAPARGNETARQAVDRIEGQIGRPLAAVRVYRLWDSAFPTDHDRWLRDTGHFLFLSVAARRMSGKPIPWQWIANAQPGWKLYDDMVRWADRIKAFGATVYFIFDHEPDAANRSVMGTPASYRAAWQNLVTIFRSQGVHNVRFVWTLTAYSFARSDWPTALDWYPGDAYVDGIGADGYNFAACRPGVPDQWRSFAQIFEPVRQFGLAHPGPFLAIPEWGSVEGAQGQKAQWITEAAATLRSPGWQQFRAVLYWNSQSRTTPTCEFWFDTSQSAENAFAAMGADPYFFAVGPPIMQAFSPATARAGAQVTLTGRNFVSVHSVTFNGVSATFSVTGPTQIVATVPSGATAGPIEVTTDAGSTSSPGRFGVVHPRDVTLELVRHLVARGVLSVPDGFQACLGQALVSVQRRLPHKRWRLVAVSTTGGDGRYHVRLPDRAARYRSVVTGGTLSSGDVCGPARSRARRSA